MMEKTTENGLSISKHICSKIEAIESSLHQTIYNFRDLITEFEQMHMQSESLRKQMILQKEKCESKCCNGAEDLKKVIESKDNIIQLVASALTKLNESRNFNILSEAFKILFGESKSLENNVEVKEEIHSDDIDIQIRSPTTSKNLPQENLPLEDQDDSVSELPETPTGRCSPIIHTKKVKCSTPSNSLRDKKKCPGNWITPEKKSVKLSTPGRSKGSGRLRQQRLSAVRDRRPLLVDLTKSPGFGKGRGSLGEDGLLNNIKHEVIESDDTIMPSPTSGTVYPQVLKKSIKESPQKFQRPLSLIRMKGERAEPASAADLEAGVAREPDADVTNVPELEESVNLLQGLGKGFVSPEAFKSEKTSPGRGGADRPCTSPPRRPLAENVNVGNVPRAADASLSILRGDAAGDGLPAAPDENTNTRIKSQILEPLYKEPTVRKKAEKRALPGWSCDECKDFYGELYKDNPEMLARKMDECSKHRGRCNPARPRTPPGFWQPRWHVPDDTEEFNRRNNAI